jgi:Protein of unknown function (DUF4058)
MASPFPGMDPYLEQFWGDVHHRLITYACDQLQGALPAELRARVQERVFVESSAGSERTMYSDIRVIERRRRGKVMPGNGGPLPSLTLCASGCPTNRSLRDSSRSSTLVPVDVSSR